MIHISRYHDISCGHRVVGHEGACAHLHGHNYRIHFTCSPHLTEGKLDDVGRVLDFSVVKKLLCEWLDLNWDHRFLVWVKDPWRDRILKIDETACMVKFNPTAENIGLYLLNELGPHLLQDTGVVLTRVVVDETRKCSAEVELSVYH